MHLENNVLFCYHHKNHRHFGGGGWCNVCQTEYVFGKRNHKEHVNDACDYFNYGNFDVMKKLSSIYDFKDEIYVSRSQIQYTPQKCNSRWSKRPKNLPNAIK
jgi:hypothetical protein